MTLRFLDFLRQSLFKSQPGRKCWTSTSRSCLWCTRSRSSSSPGRYFYFFNFGGPVFYICQIANYIINCGIKTLSCVPNYNLNHLNQKPNPDSKYGVDIFCVYFALFSSTPHHRDLEPTLKASTRGPLSIGVPLFPAASKMAKLEKKEKLKNRELI